MQYQEKQSGCRWRGYVSRKLDPLVVKPESSPGRNSGGASSERIMSKKIPRPAAAGRGKQLTLAQQR